MCNMHVYRYCQVTWKLSCHCSCPRAWPWSEKERLAEFLLVNFKSRLVDLKESSLMSGIIFYFFLFFSLQNIRLGSHMLQLCKSSNTVGSEESSVSSSSLTSLTLWPSSRQFHNSRIAALERFLINSIPFEHGQCSFHLLVFLNNVSVLRNPLCSRRKNFRAEKKIEACQMLQSWREEHRKRR